MNEREKVQKAFNQCSDALGNLDQRSIMKVFHLLSVQYDVVPAPTAGNEPVSQANSSLFSSVLKDEEAPEPSKRALKIATPKKAKVTNTKSTVYLTDYDFRPANKDSLNDFVSRYRCGSNYEYNLTFAYYLQEVVGEAEITTDHIYSCYRHLGLKLPSFPSTLKDTGRHRGWLDAANSNNIRVTRSGINYLEHSLPKADE